MAGPTAPHGNMAKADIPAQLTLQRKVTAGTSPQSTRRVQLSAQRQGNPAPSPPRLPNTGSPRAPHPWAAGSSGAPTRMAPRSSSLLERHQGEDKQPAHGRTHFRTWEYGQAGPSSSAYPPAENHCTREPLVCHESLASRPAPAPEMMLCQPFRHLGEPARGSNSCT